MYERNAIVLERYFSKLFGYDEKNNLKNNYTNYTKLIEQIEKYQETTEEEDNVIAEYDHIIAKIKETQRNQDLLFKRNAKLQENRKNIFENIDENVDSLKAKLDKIREEVEKNGEEMATNGDQFIAQLSEFNEKSVNRNQCSRNRRIVENDYQRQLKETVSNINGISVEKVNEVKEFFKSENNIQEEIQGKIMQNGAREKIPFDFTVIEKAIDLQTEIEEKESEILCTVYDRTHRLLVEIKNDSVKLEKHKKLIRDSESKLNFLNAMKEYLTVFLDNERLNIVGGEKEHKKLMRQACQNLEEDFVQIKNLYTILIKEIAGRATKKMYRDLYNLQYLFDLEEKEREFENNISRLNVIGTVIYPDYWRVEGMQKIYTSFRNSVKDIYERDLSEYEPTTYEEEQEVIIEDNNEMLDDDIIDDEDFIDDEINEEKEKEIDEILGFYNFEEDIKVDEDETNEEIEDEDEENIYDEDLYDDSEEEEIEKVDEDDDEDNDDEDEDELDIEDYDDIDDEDDFLDDEDEENLDDYDDIDFDDLDDEDEFLDDEDFEENKKSKKK
ncbi:MAG: hypothetical protein HFJ17_00945 [Clostridia bacterium]|nr:hypothetical protein [Clostridia bacterium]